MSNYYDEFGHKGFDREVERKTAEKYLLDSVSMFRFAGFPLWYFIKMTARFWFHLYEERKRLQQWKC